MAARGREGSGTRRLRDHMIAWKTFIIQSTTACKDLLMHQFALFISISSGRMTALIDRGLHYINWRWLAIVLLFFHCLLISWAWNLIFENALHFKQTHPHFEIHEPTSVQHQETTEFLLALWLNSLTDVCSFYHYNLLCPLWKNLHSVCVSWVHDHSINIFLP